MCEIVSKSIFYFFSPCEYRVDMDVGQEDLSQVLALGIIWILILAFGSSICFVPIIYTVFLAYQDAFSRGISYGSHASVSGFLAAVNVILFMAVGSLIGYPIASASGKVSLIVNSFLQ